MFMNFKFNLPSNRNMQNRIKTQNNEVKAQKND